MEYYKNLSLENIVAYIEGIGEVREEWKDVIGWNGFYQISNFGRVKSVERFLPYKTHSGKDATFHIKPIIMRQYESVGYLKVDLYRNAKRKKKFVHIMVAECFLRNPHNKPIINHKKANRKLNLPHEIEWSTFSENLLHAYDTGLTPRGENHHNSKLTEHGVMEIKKLFNTGYYSHSLLANIFGSTRRNISSIVSGKSWKWVKA